jgi:hypothetical protein
MAVIPENKSIFFDCQLDVFDPHHCLISIHVLWPSCQVASNNSEIFTHITRFMHGIMCKFLSAGKFILEANMYLFSYKWGNVLYVLKFLPPEQYSV